jgi:exonuclease SbcD
MRIAHVADVHAGAVTHSRTDPTSGLPSALEATLRSFEAVVDIALERSVDAVIVAGDLYHSPNPIAPAIVGIEAQVRRLREELIPTLLYPGNHDRAPRPDQASIVSVHHGGSIVADLGDLGLAALGDLVVGVLPSFSRQVFGNVSREEAELRTLERLEGFLDRTGGRRPDIVTGHWPVSGSALGGEVDISIIAEPMLSPADLEGPWRYAAMGHIHRAQPIVAGETVVGAYSGGIDRFNFGEEDYRPVALVVDLEEGGATEEIELPARVFRTIELAAPMVGELSTQDLVAANEGGIVRIRGRFEAGEPHRTAVKMAGEMSRVLYDSGASIVYVELEQVRPDRVRAADITEAPTELEALERWVVANDIEPEIAEPLREFARGLVEEAAR